MNINPLIPIGSKIKIDKSKIKNFLPKKLLDKMPQIINGEVIDYKMTDGIDIGYVLMTENNLKLWVFTREFNEDTKREYKIDLIDTSKTLTPKEFISIINKVHYDINGNRSIKSMANPINIISWLIFSTKDII